MALVAGPAGAQNINNDPIYATVNLSAGFDNDPYTVDLSSGGSNAASELGSPCSGYIATSPDVRLVYDAGSLPLIISVNSKADTTLVVNAPDGRWYCDDDGGNGNNPSVRFNSPRSGRYEVWVGTYGSGEMHSATLNISELYSQ
ncbi:peptidase S1 [Aurantiacibacter spongiae]|uniref:Peptidase S1 n=2 Tax=Aurantiacibacter spongiae TaxID=2488860 RepID=A0A3N5CV20_9SPHN|nr:peptidase S1 [Aurantiacibacter spongiae]